MARKTKGGAGRRPGQQRPRTTTPARRVTTAPPAAEPTVEQRLAELEAERDRLLAAAQAMAEATAPARDEQEHPGTDEEAEEEPRRVATATAPRLRPAPMVAQPSASGARRVGRIAPAAVAAAPVVKAPPRGVARAEPALDVEDPSIPLERVPYVRADLRRVAVIAGVMVILIVIADFVVRAVVK